MSLEQINKTLESLEAALKSQADKADGEMKTLGKVSTDTKTALESLEKQQRELGERILGLEQKGVLRSEDQPDAETWGRQFVKHAGFEAFRAGGQNKIRVEVKNTVTNTVGNTFADRKPGMVGGAFRTLTLEQLLVSLPTTSNAVDYVRENVFTNSAAETAEGGAKPESSITTTLVTEPVATVAHWIKISRQLAMDNAALAAYIDLRMRYGVNLRVENQIINGNGVAPNISGFTKAGNFTAHGYTAANLAARFGAGYTRLDMLRGIIGDCDTSDYPADAIILNPVDWANLETLKDSQGRYLIGNPNDGSDPRIWRTKVVASNAVTADTVIVASLMNAGTFYNREGVVVDMSESDSDNFTKNLVTLRAERRCMLAIERPAAVRYGDLTPA
jgi:HK97 family phage major capsid protein